MAKRIFHVHTHSGELYGVAASGKIEAKQFVQDRLTREESDDYPVLAVFIGLDTANAWTYGTVLHY